MTAELSILERLSNVQNDLKAPKGQYNDFGKYKYRSSEDILEAVKPLLAKWGLNLTLTDELVQIGERYYVKATAWVNMLENIKESVTVTSYAREEDTRKGMGADQLTGAASSYARKYALNGLFLIDDTKDSDHTNDHGKASAAPKPMYAKKELAPTLDKALLAEMKRFTDGWTEQQKADLCTAVLGKNKPESDEDLQNLIKAMPALDPLEDLPPIDLGDMR